MLAVLSVGLPALKWLIGSKVGRYALAALAGLVLLLTVLIALKVHDHNVRASARASAISEMETATATESARRLKVLQDTRAQADADDTKRAALQSHNEKLKNEIARLSAANNDKPCLDAGSVQRLRSLGRPAGG